MEAAISLVIIKICQLTAEARLLDTLGVKNLVTTINDHLRPENSVIIKELVGKLKNNSLEPVPFKGLDSTQLCFFCIWTIIY